MTYIDGYLIPVRKQSKDSYRAMAAAAAAVFREYGALQIVECWADDIQSCGGGDLLRAVDATEGENVVLSWVVWPSREVRDAGHARAQSDSRLNLSDPIFNPSRMIWGGFEPIVQIGETLTRNPKTE